WACICPRPPWTIRRFRAERSSPPVRETRSPHRPSSETSHGRWGTSRPRPGTFPCRPASATTRSSSDVPPWRSRSRASATSWCPRPRSSPSCGKRTTRTRTFPRSDRSRRTEGVTLERYRSIVDDWAAFESAAGTPEPTVFRVGTARIAEAALLARLADQGFRTRPVPGMPTFHQVVEEPHPVSMTFEHWYGLLYVQQASTGVAAPALGPLPGERVLDLCAAPGGKTAHLAQLMGDQGCLVASEISESRICGLLGNLYRLGHT